MFGFPRVASFPASPILRRSFFSLDQARRPLNQKNVSQKASCLFYRRGHTRVGQAGMYIPQKHARGVCSKGLWPHTSCSKNSCGLVLQREGRVSCRFETLGSLDQKEWGLKAGLQALLWVLCGVV